MEILILSMAILTLDTQGYDVFMQPVLSMPCQSRKCLIGMTVQFHGIPACRRSPDGTFSSQMAAILCNMGTSRR